MLDLKQFLLSVSQIAEEKGIPQETVLEVIESALATAYRKDYGKKGQIIKTKLDPKTGTFKVFQIKLVVDESMLKKEGEKDGEKEKKEKTKESETESETEGAIKKVRFNPERHIMLEEAKKTQKKIKPGDEFLIPLETKEEFGRIAAQSAKQVIIQRLKEAEKLALLSDFKRKEGEIASGIVQRFEAGNVYLDLGKVTAVMHREEQIPRERYKIGNRIRFLVLKVEETTKGPIVFVSRAHPDFVKKLFEFEVPEIANGVVEIKVVVREPGVRSKVAVKSNQKGVDPIGSCVGQKGTRISTIINELFGEKIDVVEWSDDAAEFISNALSPAKILDVELDKEKKEAKVIVPEDQISLVIGKGGQNVRLAAKLVGWKIDVRSSAKPEEKIETPTIESSTEQTEQSKTETKIVETENKKTEESEENKEK